MKGIYAITNQMNGQSYIGSAVDIRKRWKQHRKNLDNGTHHSKSLQTHWKQYGSKNFEFKVLEHICDATNSSLTNREQYWIDKLDSYHNGYNSTLIASRPFTFSDEERKQKEWQRNFERYHGIPSEPQYVEKMRKRPLDYDQEEQEKWERENLQHVLNLKQEKERQDNQRNIDRKLGWIVGVGIVAVACVVPVLVLPAVYVGFFTGAWVAGRKDNKIYEIEQELEQLKKSEPEHAALIAREKEIDLERSKRKRKRHWNGRYW